MPQTNLPRVVIVGSGFAGLTAAKRLRRAPVRLTVIDRQNHHVFQPLLYQVATAALSPADIAAPIRSVLRPGRSKVNVLLDEVQSVDVRSRTVRTRDGHSIPYDYAVIASGSTYSYFGRDAWAQFAPGLKTIEDARTIRFKILSAFERAEAAADPGVRERLMTFVVVGGGPTGVEMAGALAELAKATLARDFCNIDPRSARILLVEAGTRLLATFPEKQGSFAERALAELGVTVLKGEPVANIDEEGLIVGSRRIASATVLWCAGVRATAVGEWLGEKTLPNGTIEVRKDFSIPSTPDVFVIGDAATWRDESGRPLPALAPVAKQEGQFVAALIAARVRGTSGPSPFRYRDWGSMATIGRSAAVGVFGRVKLQGFIAWLLWGGVHLFYVIGFRNRAAVLLDWIWAWLTYSRGARLITIPRNVEMETATASLPKTRSEHRPMVPTGATEREPASTT